MSNAEPTEAQIVAAARVLNKRHATLCNVNEADSWAIQGDDFREDARAALRAALAQQPAASGEPVAFDAEGFRAFVLRELPDDTIIGKGEWWSDHLTKRVQWFVKPAAPQPAPAPTMEALHAATIAQQHRVPYALVQDIAKALGAQPAPAPAASGEPAEHVAEVGPVWSLVWAGAEPLAHLLARHPGVRIGSKLYAAPQPAPVDHTPLLRMLAQRARSFPNFPIGAHIPEVFSALGEDRPDWQAAQPAPARVQLTDARIDEEWFDIYMRPINAVAKARLLARAIEAAHGITAKEAP